ncbi:GCN5 family acetyltransferase [Kiloniella spongiae]|uniref:GCN5 family acetyltransferase n=1 Tax=Kiloniella spongiae TaxID=1489064 RepID=A0A0H2MF84_9PROT|nr:GNAT family N-acetyltransferase [Kiloniella spongiae]KLN61209.1 GCN5 family acetyltransferase [Kiloniella spongiae]
MNLRQMLPSDHPDLITLFKATPGVALRDADTYDATTRYLERNPGLNFVIEEGKEIIACVMCGHDGRRGYLQHLIVKPNYRKMGLGEKLFTACLSNLSRIGINKTHIFVFKNNGIANSFWQSKGWQLREDVHLYSYTSSDSTNA